MQYKLKKVSEDLVVVNILLTRTKMVVWSTTKGAVAKFIPTNTKYIEPPETIPSLPPLTLWHYHRFKPPEWQEEPIQVAPHVWYFKTNDFMVARAWSKFWQRGTIIATNGVTTEVLPSLTLAFYHFSRKEAPKAKPPTKSLLLPWWALEIDGKMNLLKLGKHGWYFNNQPINLRHAWYLITTNGATIKEIKEVSKNEK